MTGGAATFVTAAIRNNVLLASPGAGASGLDASALNSANLCADVMGNLTDTALAFFAGGGATIDIVDLPALSFNNFGSTVFAVGAVQNAASCPP